MDIELIRHYLEEMTCKEFVELHQLDPTWRDEKMIDRYKRKTTASEIITSPEYCVETRTVIISADGEEYILTDLENLGVEYVAQVED